MTDSVSLPASLPLTPSQTIGPFSHEAWRWAIDATAGDAAGSTATATTSIRIAGIIHDGDGLPINDAVIEAWLPAAAQVESAQPLPAFRRVPSDDGGNFFFDLPHPASMTNGEPVLYVTVFARGLVKHQFTAVFLEDDTGLAKSAMLEQVPAARRATLIAKKHSEGRYTWNIWLQTEHETVFFDYA
jgi:protocatechuate 3,4-dioxygenase alpha subunit